MASTNGIMISLPDTIEKSFYKRPLPEHLIPFSSSIGKQLFKESLLTGYMECYFALAEQFTTQTTLTIILNALEIDPKRLWKYPWRWFSEDLLDCCVPLEIAKKEGITFNHFACLAKCNDANLVSFRAKSNQTENNNFIPPSNNISSSHHTSSSSKCDFSTPYEESTETSFREIVKEVCSGSNPTSTEEKRFLVVSFNRSVLGQTGEGHYSPLAAYNEEKDMVLVMDTAKFKYPPFWVSLHLLYESMIPIDKSTGLSRGFFIIQRNRNDSNGEIEKEKEKDRYEKSCEKWICHNETKM